MSHIHVGILEDDEEQSALLTLWLTDAGYEVSAFTSGTEFIKAQKSNASELMILDWMVPEMNGLEVLTWVRANVLTNVPVLFLTTRSKEERIVEALQAGADDYVTKPVSRGLLLARLSALARRGGLTEKETGTLTIGEFVLDRQAGQVTRNDEAIPLTSREFQLVWVLFNKLSGILSREYLLRHIWNISAAVNTRTVDTHISRVRSKLGLRPENGWRLSSIYHHGYRLEQLDRE